MKKSVEYIPVTCPECGCRNTRIYESFRVNEIGIKERWHRCRKCECQFASFERVKNLQNKNDGV